MPSPSPTLPERATWLRDLLERAGEASLAHFGPGGAIRRKPDQSPVTEGDLAAERVLVAGLRARFPRDAILSEEAGSLTPTLGAGSGWTWLVDPIDGTSTFTEGLAHWGPVVARVEPATGAIDCGAIWLPRVREHYHVEGGVAWFDGLPIPPMAQQRASRAVYLPSRFHAHSRLAFEGKGRCVGGTAAHLALTARGSALATIVAPGWSLWDTAAGVALIGAVGGTAKRFPGGEALDLFRDEGAAFVAGEPASVEELLRPGRIALLAEGDR